MPGLEKISPAAAVQGVVGVVQAGIGIAQSISGNARLKRLLKQREDYKTPDEVAQAFQMAQQQAQQGFGAETMSYFTNQTNNALTSSLDAAKKLGGNPNDIAAIFSKNIDAIMKTSSDSELTRVQKFDKIYTTLAGVVQGKDAESADRKAKFDDATAAEAMKVKAGNENLKSGLNGIMGAVANNELSKKGKDGITGIASPVNTSAQSTSQSAQLGTTVTGAPLGGQIALPSIGSMGAGATPDYQQLLNFWNSQFQRR